MLPAYCEEESQHLENHEAKKIRVWLRPIRNSAVGCLLHEKETLACKERLVKDKLYSSFLSRRQEVTHQV
jgi:hypothetical protein